MLGFIKETMDFENDSFYLTPGNTTLEEQNEIIETETGTILPEISGTGECAGGREAGGILSEMAQQDQ